MGRITKDMFIATLCQEMGWDYEQYQKQPKWFIELLKTKWEIDSDNMRKEISKMKRKK